ncbi:MAG: response regulator, partial [Acidobacteria bacterium]|nr:response regulator [Acidobacteriota bacterium]
MPGGNENKISKIMVVEDELIVATNIENQLRKIGYEVISNIDSGEEAICIAKEKKPDLVLMDIKLSGKMDGIEAAQYLYDQLNIPVVYLTAYLDNETLQRAKITSPYGYILKPFEINKLHITLEIALHKYQMEKMLRESERRFRTLAEYSPVGIFQTDIAGNCVYMNQRWYEITGFSPLEPVNDWKSAIHPEDRALVQENWDKMIHSDGKFAMEYRFQNAEGNVNWVFGHVTPLNPNPQENTGYIGIITDISENKKMEKKILTADRLESIGILAGGIAHDFNNLLSVIVGNISMLKNDINITQDQAGMLNSIEKAAFQAADLAQKLITFAKGVWLHRDKIVFSQFIKDIIRTNFYKYQAVFDIEIPPDLMPIDGDPGQLKQVFNNLILNAIEAQGDTKVIIIKAQNIETVPPYTPLKKGRYVEVSVIDRGMGITPEHLSKIFDPYFSTKPRGTSKGIGLGLTICYSIIQKHDGHIHILSQ